MAESEEPPIQEEEEKEEDFRVERSSAYGVIDVDIVLQLYYEEKRETFENYEKENEAARKIQIAWRAYKQKRLFWRRHLAALTIQRVYRGYKYGRKVYREVKQQKELQEKHDFYDICATKIQAVFRGYIHRKNVFDFSKRQEELATIKQRGREVTEFVNRTLQEEEISQTIKKTQKQTEHFEKIAPSLHYLVSTDSIPGVYRSQQMDPNQTLFQTSLEGALKRSTMTHFGETLPHRKIQMKLTMKERKMNDKRKKRKKKLERRLEKVRKLKNGRSLPRVKKKQNMRF